MAYSDQEVGAAKAVQDWLNAGNQWGVDMLGWDWFFSAWPEYAPYRDIIVNHRPEAIAQWDTPAPTPTPAPTQTQVQTQTQAPSNSDPNIGKVYQRIQDIPEGYEWAPNQTFGKPMTNMADIVATIDAANRGELTDYQKQFTYQVTRKKPENVLTQQAPGLYTFVKDGKEYVYAPKEFVKYGAVGQADPESGMGAPVTINPVLKSKELLDKATKTNIDTQKYQTDFSQSGIKDPSQGYVWSKQDFIKAVNPTGTTAYNYNPDDIFSQGTRTIYPDKYGTYQGQDESGNYIYRQGRSITTFDPKTVTGNTYTPGDNSFGELLPVLGILGIAFGMPFLGELGAAAAAGDVAAGEALGGILAEGGFGELSAAELANLGYDASWADALGTTGLEAWDGYQPPSNWETADMSPFETPPTTQPSVPETPPTAQPTTTPTEAAPNLEGGDLGNAPPNLEGGDLGNAPPNLEGGDLGMTEAEWQDQFYKDIGIDPSSLSDLPPATTAEIESLLNQGPNVNLSDLNKVRQMVNVSKLLQGAGLLGGTAVAAKAAQGLLGGLGGGTGAGAGIQAPKPFTGTYSGSGPTDPAYFQQIQQNYNRLFPTNPADVATPLQSWYQTKFVPDTNISNKLFGV